MSDFEDCVEEQRAKDPSFDEKFEQAKAELNLAMEISEQRQAHGWSQRDLAQKANMPQSSIARYELAGTAPSIASLWRLSTALGAWFVLGPNFSVSVLDSEPPGLPPSHPRAWQRARGGWEPNNNVASGVSLRNRNKRYWALRL